MSNRFNYSTAELIKQSASHTAYKLYLYMKNKIKSHPTVAQIQGTVHQDKCKQEKKLSNELRDVLLFSKKQ